MHYSYSYSADSEEGLVAMILFYALYAFFGGGFALLLYVFRSMGVYSIAKRRELKNPWFAWIPVVDQYLLGSLSDQYQYVAKRKVKNKRKILLGLQTGKIRKKDLMRCCGNVLKAILDSEIQREYRS